jgi:hypothetical protein
MVCVTARSVSDTQLTNEHALKRNAYDGHCNSFPSAIEMRLMASYVISEGRWTVRLCHSLLKHDAVTSDFQAEGPIPSRPY